MEKKLVLLFMFSLVLLIAYPTDVAARETGQPPEEFRVTVNGSRLPSGTGANESGAGYYEVGDTVAIRAGTRPGHDFDGWTVNAGRVTLTNVNNPTTFFTMPGNDVTVTANWTRINANNERTFTLTLRAGTGGSVAIDDGSFGNTRTGEFEPGTRVSISARPSRDYDFDRWNYSFGETINESRAETTFIMPNRNVTVWADFFHFRDWRWDDWRWDDRRWDDRRWRDRHLSSFPQAVLTPVAAGPPAAPPPEAGVLQQNNLIAGTASFTIDMPGINNGLYTISIEGLPVGIAAPANALVHNKALQLHLSGINRVPAGTYTLVLTLFDDRGNAVSVPTVFTLTTFG
jgi:uncharacterized repeat protein (TIGR02543 family)